MKRIRSDCAATHPDGLTCVGRDDFHRLADTDDLRGPNEHAGELARPKVYRPLKAVRLRAVRVAFTGDVEQIQMLVVEQNRSSASGENRPARIDELGNLLAEAFALDS